MLQKRDAHAFGGQVYGGDGTVYVGSFLAGQWNGLGRYTLTDQAYAGHFLKGDTVRPPQIEHTRHSRVSRRARHLRRNLTPL